MKTIKQHPQTQTYKLQLTNVSVQTQTSKLNLNTPRKLENANFKTRQDARPIRSYLTNLCTFHPQLFVVQHVSQHAKSIFSRGYKEFCETAKFFGPVRTRGQFQPTSGGLCTFHPNCLVSKRVSKHAKSIFSRGCSDFGDHQGPQEAVPERGKSHRAYTLSDMFSLTKFAKIVFQPSLSRV